jgi:cytochrome b
MIRTYVWDLFVRVFHWAVATGFLANAFYTPPGKDVHELIGYGVVALVALRIVWGIVGTQYARFKSFPPDPEASMGQLGEMLSGRTHVHVGHTPLGALMIYNLLLSLLLIGLTGWMQTTLYWFGVDWVEKLHGALVTWTEICVFLHVASTLFESHRTGVNLPKAMITGYKDLPERAITNG